MFLLVLTVVLTIPLGLDLYLPVPEDNPITVERVERGRQLFFDTRLSRDGTVACASCHDPERAFFWDGRAATLEEQVLQRWECESPPRCRATGTAPHRL